MDSFTEAVSMAKTGLMSKSKDSFLSMLSSHPNDYSILSNLGVLMLQTGNYAQAISYLNTAIERDPFCHIAYFNRCLCYAVTKDTAKAQCDIQHALSCLYLKIGARTHNLKHLNKAIAECNNNILAYVERAKLFQQRNNRNAAENDYLHAIEHGRDSWEVYKARALYYHSIKENSLMEQDLTTCLKLKTNTHQPFTLRSDNNCLLEPKMKEFKELLESEKEPPYTIEKIQIPPLKLTQKPITQTDQQLLLSSDRRMPPSKSPLSSDRINENTQHKKDNLLSQIISQEHETSVMQHRRSVSDESRKIKNTVPQKMPILSPKGINREGEDLDLLISEIPKESLHPQLIQSFNKTFNSIFQEQSSKVISMQLPSLNELNEQAQSTINSLKVTSPSQRSDISVNSSVFSTDTKAYTYEEFFSFKTVKVQLVSIKLFEEKETNYEYKLSLKYGDQNWELKMDNERPNQVFNIVEKQHTVSVKADISVKGYFWGKVNLNGTGTINLMERKVTKCVLENQKKMKVCLLYYKLKCS